MHGERERLRDRENQWKEADRKKTKRQRNRKGETDRWRKRQMEKKKDGWGRQTDGKKGRERQT